MENFITITYNDVDYSVHFFESTANLVRQEELLQLPLSKWQELLLKKNGYCYASDLYKVLLKKIDYEDVKSKSFIYKNKSYWLDKKTRMNIQALLNNKMDKFELILPDCIVTLDYNKAKKFMDNLELYSYNCFLTTQKHLNAMKEIKSIGDLINFDYTQGYPDKIVLDE